ncbi:hypothetical protein [Gaopeijia maritima]|uniref:Outer membrane protein beta-barrel domain-containing protein n=1 Tax=Gaopeijia maritima TaxID=3119007 RepID=A0ABU9E582_9BACT
MGSSSRHSTVSARARGLRGHARLAVAALAGCALLLPLEGASAQDVRVGGAALLVSSRYDGPPVVDFDRRSGFGAEAFVDVVTPLAPLEVRAGARFVRRGGDEMGGGGAEIDWLGFPIALGPRLRRGPVSAIALGGVEVAYPVASRRSADLESGFAEVARTGVSGLIGAELALELHGGWRVGVESRWVREFTAAFEGSVGRLHTRAHEWSIRISRAR